MDSAFPPAIGHLVAHVLSQHSIHIQSHLELPRPPLFIGVQGPQGSGKTYLTSLLQQALSAPPHGLRVAVLSLDDLYLSYDELLRVAKENSENRLLQGRGQPGTHDLLLGAEVLSALRKINISGKEVHIPAFDKSLHGGVGDRVSETEWHVVHAPLDVVMVEGWFVGFSPCTSQELLDRYKAGAPISHEVFNLAEFCKKEDIEEVNRRLGDYVKWWKEFDTFIQLSPLEGIINVYKWRTDQEHYMKAHNGGRGMSDDEVKRFVDRYIPGYVFFADGVTRGFPLAEGDEASKVYQPPPWIGRGLRIVIGPVREVIEVEKF